MTFSERVSKWQADTADCRDPANVRNSIDRSVIALANCPNTLPARFQNLTFTDYQTHSAEQVRVKILAERFVESFSDRLTEGSCLTFIGVPGTGKTMLAAIMCEALHQQHFSVCYESSVDFIKTLLEIRFASQAQFTTALKQYSDPKLLIIDEVTESLSKGGIPSEQEKQVLLKIINTRYENRLCTLIISNRDKAELVSRLGLPITDRLAEKGVTLIFNWKSYRQN